MKFGPKSKHRPQTRQNFLEPPPSVTTSQSSSSSLDFAASISANTGNADKLRHLLKSQIGLNLQNNKAIYNLYELDVCSNDSDFDSVKASDPDIPLTTTISNSSAKSSGSFKLRSNPLKILRSRGYSDGVDVKSGSHSKQETDPGLRNSSKSADRLTVSSSRAEYAASAASKIKVSVINSSDKVFLPVSQSRDSPHRQMVNRSFAHNINMSLDDELDQYENRSLASDIGITDTGDNNGSNSENPDATAAADEDDSSTLVSHTMAIVVSVPSPNINIDSSPYEELSDDFDDSSKTQSSLSSSSFVSSIAPGKLELSTTPSKLESSDIRLPRLASEQSVLETSVDLSNIIVSINMLCKLMWKGVPVPVNDPLSRIDEEEFTVGDLWMKLDLLKDFNYFVPSDSNVDKNSLSRTISALRGSSLSLESTSTGILSGAARSQDIQKIKLKNLDKIKEDPYFNKDTIMAELLKKEEEESSGWLFRRRRSQKGVRPNLSNVDLKTSKKSQTTFKYPAGDYVFVIPMAFNSSLPESVRSPRGCLNYQVDFYIQRFLSKSKPLTPSHTDQSSNASKRLSIGSAFKMFTSSFNNEGFHEVDFVKESDYDHFEEHSMKTMTAVKSIVVDEDESDSEPIPDSPLELTKTKSNSSTSNIRQYLNQELINKSFYLPFIRTSPPLSLPANLPLFIDKVWNNDLAYQIMMPTKFVRLNSEIPISINLTPNTKNVILKGVQINVLERVQYVSKDLHFDYQEGKNSSKDHNIKEIIVPLTEVRTTFDGHLAIREDIIHFGDLHANESHSMSLRKRHNLLERCLHDTSKGGDEDILIDRTLKMKIPLFFKGIRSSHAKYHNTNHIPETKNQEKSRHSLTKSLIRIRSRSSGEVLPDDYLYLGKTYQDLEAEAEKSNTVVSYGDQEFAKVTRYVPKSIDGISNDFHYRRLAAAQLHPDSSRFNYITITHRIQVCFRISKIVNEFTHQGEPITKTHSYEVIIDAPIMLVSDLCEEENISLPVYLERSPRSRTLISSPVREHLPTFEEATSPVASPRLRFGEESLDLSPLTLYRSHDEDVRSNVISSPGSFGDPNSLSRIHSTPIDDILAEEFPSDSTGLDPSISTDLEPRLLPTYEESQSKI